MDKTKEAIAPEEWLHENLEDEDYKNTEYDKLPEISDSLNTVNALGYMRRYAAYITKAKDIEIETLKLYLKAVQDELTSIRNCEAEILRNSVELKKENDRLKNNQNNRKSLRDF